jgi:hypothetical protein
MNQETLTIEDKTRLAQLVTNYLNPSQTFTINGRGEVVLVKRTLINRILNLDTEVRLDFMEVTKKIITKMMDEKGGQIPYVAQLCGKSFGELIESNERSAVIKGLYLAHLVDEQPANIGRNPADNQKKDKVIPKGYGEIVSFHRVSDNHKLACDVAEVMNHMAQTGEVIIYDHQQ